MGTTKAQIKEFCAMLFSGPDADEVIAHIEADDNDFEVDGVRFIEDAAIDRIQQDELASDEYVLGCFADWLIADITGIDVDAVKDIQKSGQHDELGNIILTMPGALERLQAEYVRYDGYGAHFNHYNGEEDELRVNGNLYHVFDNH